MRFFIRLILVGMLATCLPSCSKHSELHDAMEEMGDALKAAKKSDNNSELALSLQEFEAATLAAAQQSVKPEHQAEFDQGMEKVADLIAEIQAALTDKNEKEVASLLEELTRVQDEYHEKLGIEE